MVCDDATGNGGVNGGLHPIAHAAHRPEDTWHEPHDLSEHQLGVAKKAVDFATGFRSSGWARLAGLWNAGV